MCKINIYSAGEQVKDTGLKSFLKKIYAPIFQVGIRNHLTLKKGHVLFKRLLIKGYVDVTNSGEIIMGNNVIIHSGAKNNVLGNSVAFEVYEKGKLRIGNGVNMSNVRIRCEDEVLIDDDVMLGGGVTIIDSNCHSLDFQERMFSKDAGAGGILSCPVHIKRGAFIGANALVLKGVTIGEEAIVAAGSVVTSDIPNKEIWGGNPARFLRKI